MRKFSAAVLALCGLILMAAEPQHIDKWAFIVPVTGILLVLLAVYIVRNEEV